MIVNHIRHLRVNSAVVPQIRWYDLLEMEHKDQGTTRSMTVLPVESGDTSTNICCGERRQTEKMLDSYDIVWENESFL